MAINRFNLRAYGLLVNEKKELLVSDEFRANTLMTKLPGGGLEYGEGLAEGLKREWMEELNVPVRPGELIYVNDFLQVSAFNPKDQIIAFYYQIELLAPIPVKISEIPFDFEQTEGAQSFRWIPLELLSPDDFTFPIDKAMARQIHQHPVFI